MSLEKEIVNAEREQTKFKKTQISHELGLQVKERQAKDIAEKVERKTKVMTSGGPTMLHEDQDEVHKKVLQQKLLVRINLEKQKGMDNMEKMARKDIKLQEEREDNDRINAKQLEAQNIKQ